MGGRDGKVWVGEGWWGLTVCPSGPGALQCPPCAQLLAACCLWFQAATASPFRQREQPPSCLTTKQPRVEQRSYHQLCWEGQAPPGQLLLAAIRQGTPELPGGGAWSVSPSDGCDPGKRDAAPQVPTQP